MDPLPASSVSIDRYDTSSFTTNVVLLEPQPVVVAELGPPLARREARLAGGTSRCATPSSSTKAWPVAGSAWMLAWRDDALASGRPMSMPSPPLARPSCARPLWIAQKLPPGSFWDVTRKPTSTLGPDGMATGGAAAPGERPRRDHLRRRDHRRRRDPTRPAQGALLHHRRRPDAAGLGERGLAERDLGRRGWPKLGAMPCGTMLMPGAGGGGGGPPAAAGTGWAGIGWRLRGGWRGGAGPRRRGELRLLRLAATLAVAPALLRHDRGRRVACEGADGRGGTAWGPSAETGGGGATCPPMETGIGGGHGRAAPSAGARPGSRPCREGPGER